MAKSQTGRTIRKVGGSHENFKLFSFIDASDKKGSVVMIFTIWKALMGSAIVALPWAFQQSGIVLGCVISFTSFITSYHTTMLVINSTKNDENFAKTCRKQLGKCSRHLT